jgi:hypothetical protein
LAVPNGGTRAFSSHIWEEKLLSSEVKVGTSDSKPIRILFSIFPAQGDPHHRLLVGKHEILEAVSLLDGLCWTGAFVQFG